MSNLEWNAGIDFLKNAEVGSFVEYDNRKVWVEDMCGGRYLLTEDGEICYLTDSLIEAMAFLDRRFEDNTAFPGTYDFPDVFDAFGF